MPCDKAHWCRIVSQNVMYPHLTRIGCSREAKLKDCQRSFLQQKTIIAGLNEVGQRYFKVFEIYWFDVGTTYCQLFRLKFSVIF